MAEEDFTIETPVEPHAVIPNKSLIQGEHSPSSFRDLKIVEDLNEGKFKVFLVESEEAQEGYAMKVFGNDSYSQECYQNEIRFSSLNHPNVIKTIHHEQNRRFKTKNNRLGGSIILTEFAPFGDFLDFVDNFHQCFNEKLIRTYFRQLIQGLEYLQNRNIAHLDIKLENLLMGEDYQLKIADFDLSIFTTETHIAATGTKFYRAPEIIEKECKDGKAADVYSAGVVLFVLTSGGKVPHTESSLYKGKDLMGLLEANNAEFWRAHCQIQNKDDSEFSPSFRELINGMLKTKPEERLTIREIKNSNWYNEPIYTNEELADFLNTTFGL